MAIVEEQERTYPDVWVSRDYAPNGTTVRRITGIRCNNTTPVPVTVRVTYGPQGAVADWWTAIGRSDNVITVGESVNAQTLSVPAGQADSFAVSVGEA